MGGQGLNVVGLFAGIGGIELGLHRVGHRSEFLCEIDEGARAVLAKRFPEVDLAGDVRDVRAIPKADLVVAGFPCQDLSQAGRTAGISGRNSGLVGEVFRLVSNGRGPTWLLLENVPFMLQLDRGRAMRFLTRSLEEEGFAWAYRVIDTRAFGLPQRRQRVILLGSRTEDPREVLFQGDAGEQEPIEWRSYANGFYWTEGTKGLGWAVDAVPTLKGGSSVGIPSPPAIWMPEGFIVTPHIRDAERLQGFPAGWTDVRVRGKSIRRGYRWKMVGNAVSVPVAEWVGRRLRDPQPYDAGEGRILQDGDPWPIAAWGREGKASVAPFGPWPVRRRRRHLAQFLKYPTTPLSERATAGFLARAESSRLRFPEGFLEALAAHLKRMRAEGASGVGP